MAPADQFYTDIHSHFLFGVDDGAPDEQETLKMLHQAVGANIKKMIATPHALELMNDELSGLLQERFFEVQKMIKEERLELEIKLGAEMYFHPQIYKWLSAPWATVNHQNKYLLFELPFFELPPGVGDFIFQCRLKGMTPILAHPERYSYLRGDVETLGGWHQQGCLLQMNAGSINGHFGKRISAYSKTLLEMGLIHFVASDAHDTEYRNYLALAEAEKKCAEFLEQDYLDELFRINPEKVFDNMELESRFVDVHHSQSVKNRISLSVSRMLRKIKF